MARGERKEEGSPRRVLSSWNLFLSPSPRLVSFSPLSRLSRAPSLPSAPFTLSLSRSLASCIYSSSFSALFPRKLQSMPRRRTMEYVCVLVDSSLASVSLSLRALSSSSSSSRRLQSDSVALLEVRFRRRVSFSLSLFPTYTHARTHRGIYLSPTFSLSVCSTVPLARLSRTIPAFNQAPESRIHVRNFAYLYTSGFCQCLCFLISYLFRRSVT